MDETHKVLTTDANLIGCCTDYPETHVFIDGKKICTEVDWRDAMYNYAALKKENAQLKLSVESFSELVECYKSTEGDLKKALEYYAADAYNGHNGSGALAKAALSKLKD